jgi:hypothetical protein
VSVHVRQKNSTRGENVWVLPRVIGACNPSKPGSNALRPKEILEIDLSGPISLHIYVLSSTFHIVQKLWIVFFLISLCFCLLFVFSCFLLLLKLGLVNWLHLI